MRPIDICIKEITHLLRKCEDTALLDFIYQLLKKHQSQA